MDELKLILVELSKEFTKRQNEFTLTNKIGYGIKIGNYAVKGTKRNQPGAHQMGITFDLQMYYQQLTYLLNTFSSGEKLHDFITANNMWHEEIQPFKGTTMSLPNMVGRVGGGFLCRNFELNNHSFIITNDSFEKSYKELIDYFSKDYITCQHYIHLKGIGGEIEEVILNENASIVRAGFERAKFFSINYNLPNYHDMEVYEDDYLLQINFKIPKEFYKRGVLTMSSTLKRDEITKWKNFAQLAIPNLLIFGKEIQLSNDWVMEHNFAMGPYGNERRIWDKPKMVLTPDIVTNLHSSAKVVSNMNFKSLDKKILYSLERLTKSKAALDINDRVIDLAISFEYLINTSNMDVTLQLCLKVIKLICDQSAEDDEIFKILKAFYNLRSKVIHGNDKLVNDEKNILIIDYAEKIIRHAILTFIELNQKYSYDQIDKQLIRSLYRTESLRELLKQVENSKIN